MTTLETLKKERDGLLKATEVIGVALTRLFHEIDRLKADRDTVVADRDAFSENLSSAQAHIEAALTKLLIYKGYATPDQLREAMREAVKILQ